MDNWSRRTINVLLRKYADLVGESHIEALMIGFIVVVFMHNGKYYIMDWKSNHFGNSNENYIRNVMDEAKKASNYKPSVHDLYYGR